MCGVTIIWCLEFFQLIFCDLKKKTLFLFFFWSLFPFLKTVWPSTYFKHFRVLVEILCLNNETCCQKKMCIYGFLFLFYCFVFFNI